MKDSSYHLLAGALDVLVWGGEMLGEENLPDKGPAIFIANHLGPLGPIGTISSIPFRLYPWIVGEMVDPNLAPDYIRVDFVEPRLKLAPPFSQKFSKALTRITIPLIQSIEGIPTYYHGMKALLFETLEKSLIKLMEEKCLLVFPEYAIIGSDSMKKIYPFQKTVFRLGEMYYKATQQHLGYYPIGVHETHKIKVGSPYYYSNLTQPATERLRLKNLLEKAVHQLYDELDRKNQLEPQLTYSTN